MKLLIAAAAISLSGSAFAADMVEIETPPSPERFGYDWTGLYIGAMGGVAVGDFDYGAGLTGGPTVVGLSVSGGGGFVGAQIGYDWQIDNVVIGAVADIAATNHKAELTLSALGTSVTATSKLDYLGTVRGRLGYAMDRILFYAHGGLAYGKTSQSASALGVTLTGPDTSKLGYTIGGGVEYAMFDHISFQTEYAYTDLGKDAALTAGGITVTEDLKFHTLKAAVNFRF